MHIIGKGKKGKNGKSVVRFPFFVLTKMNFSNISRCLGLFLLLSSPAHALVIYDSRASSTFTLLSPDGMAITITTPAEPSSAAATGTGTVSIDADSQAGALPVFTMDSHVSGSADAPAGSSTATVLNNLFVTLDNSLGTTSATAEFEFSWTLVSAVTRTDTAKEAGFASPFLHLSGFAPSGDETLEIDEQMGAGRVAVPDYLVNPVVELPLGTGSAGTAIIGGTSVLAYVTVPAGNIDSFSVITDSFGGAMHVPAPATLALFGLGLIGLGYSRRNKRRG